MKLTKSQLIEAIARNKVNAQDTRFDAHMRSMFRKCVAAYQMQLKALEQAA